MWALSRVCMTLGPTRIWTAIAGFRVQSANRYTIGPYVRHLYHVAMHM